MTTPRERVLRALNSEKPDRAPIDLGGMRASGIASSACPRLKRRLGAHTPSKVADAVQIPAEVEPEVLDALHVDVAPLDVATAAWQPAEPARRHVRRNARAFDRPEAGFVFIHIQVHDIQPNVPAENIETMLAAARESGGAASPPLESTAQP